MPRKPLTLETVAGGAVPELFQHELEKVLANIRDVNTMAKKPRSITVVVSFRAKEDRQGNRRQLDVAVDVTSRLAPVKGLTSDAFLAKGEGGQLVVTCEDPAQAELELGGPAEEAVNPATGEVQPAGTPGAIPLHGPRPAVL